MSLFTADICLGIVIKNFKVSLAWSRNGRHRLSCEVSINQKVTLYAENHGNRHAGGEFFLYSREQHLFMMPTQNGESCFKSNKKEVKRPMKRKIFWGWQREFEIYTWIEKK